MIGHGHGTSASISNLGKLPSYSFGNASPILLLQRFKYNSFGSVIARKISATHRLCLITVEENTGWAWKSAIRNHLSQSLPYRRCPVRNHLAALDKVRSVLHQDFGQHCLGSYVLNVEVTF